MNVDTYFPWVERVAAILRWFWDVMSAQIDPDPGYFYHEYSPEMWPYWEWAAFEGCRSTESSPWFYVAGWKGVYGGEWF